MNDQPGRTIRLRDGRQLGYTEWGDPNGRPLLYFHGWPGSRVEGRLADQSAKATGVRLIALDRPGMGLSAFQPRRTLLDWPDDVVQTAAALGLDGFAILGISGGGPYAAVCARKLPERLDGVGIVSSLALVSSLAPLDVRGATAGMGRLNRASFKLAGRLPAVRRVLMARVAVSVPRRPDRVLKRGLGAAVDKQYLDRPDVRNVLVDALSEAFRSGSRGPAWELGLYARPWGFRVDDIRGRVHLGTERRMPTPRSPWVAIWPRPFRSVRPASIRGRATCISLTVSPRSSPQCVRDQSAARPDRSVRVIHGGAEACGEAHVQAGCPHSHACPSCSSVACWRQ